MLHLAFMTPFYAQPPKLMQQTIKLPAARTRSLRIVILVLSALDSVSTKDKMLSDNIIMQLYFTIRVHHKCEIIPDSVRAKTKASSKDRALRAKLTK